MEDLWNKLGSNRCSKAFIHLYSQKLKILLKRTEFNLEKIVFDSTEFQFWGSEQFKRGIPLNASNSYFKNPEKSIFTKNQINEYKKQSIMLNNENLGDQATFIIKKL